MTHFFRNKIGTTKIPRHSQDILIDQYADISANREILVGEKSMLKYLVVGTDARSRISVKTVGSWSDIQIFGIFLGKKTQADIQVQIDHSQTQAHVHLISFFQDESAIEVNGDIAIAPGTTKVIAGLLQENIILGDHIHIQAKPMLSVASNDVQANHGAKIERIDSEKLLYMTSRGLTPQQAQKLVIQWYFNHIYEQMKIGMNDQDAEKLKLLLDKYSDECLVTSD